MLDGLVRIKRAVLAGRYAFSEKARIEMELDGILDPTLGEVLYSPFNVNQTRMTSLWKYPRRISRLQLRGKLS